MNYRMAYVATVTLVDEQGEALVTRRYAIEASDSEQDMLARAMADVRHALHRRSDLRVAVIQDGAHEMWNLVRPELNALKDTGIVIAWYEAIDFCHLIERLEKPSNSSIAKAVNGNCSYGARVLSKATRPSTPSPAICDFIAETPRVLKSTRNSTNTSPISKTTTTGCAIELCVSKGCPSEVA